MLRRRHVLGRIAQVVGQAGVGFIEHLELALDEALQHDLAQLGAGLRGLGAGQQLLHQRDDPPLRRTDAAEGPLLQRPELLKRRRVLRRLGDGQRAHVGDDAVDTAERLSAGAHPRGKCFRVTDIHRLLPDRQLFIIGEHFLPVHHQLLALPGATLAEVVQHYSALNLDRLHADPKIRDVVRALQTGMPGAADLELPPVTHEPRLAHEDNVHYLNAATSGLFVPEVEHWKAVRAGGLLGHIVSPMEGRRLAEVRSPCDGVLFTLREYPLVYEGSLMARVVADAEPENGESA